MRTLDALLADPGVRGRRVLVRTDLNVPLDGTRITDDGRVRASLPTLRRLAGAGARVVVCSHLGRPRGVREPSLSLAPVAGRLAELLGEPVVMAADVAGPGAAATVAGLVDGGVAMLENVRFEAAETGPDPAARAGLADRLAALADVYVGDAFGAVHRAHASVVDLPARLPHAAGDLVVAELRVLHRLTRDPARPYVVVLGGSKVSDKLNVIERLLPVVDRLLVGGGMCFTFLAACGLEVGDSLLEPDRVADCRRLLEQAGDRLVLPVDVVVATEVSPEAHAWTVPVEAIPAGAKGLDIGPETVRRFAGQLDGAATVFWNGPMGVFELAPFAAGTRGVAEAVAAATRSGATTVVGGGDSAAAVRGLGLESSYSHISTGGGASLEYLEGATLPGLAALDVVG